ncbi:alpha-tocopherol transfer protein-like [Uranotaenia lowii]|uniref:alpha-tocopherol transfer protein-like n=1 Tax=Uranotaenia lowii TaxID=190385 RepID=UPI00247B0BAF|nr:alpha-tocopherol transfer protein-like [Uranotaenia lowii]
MAVKFNEKNHPYVELVEGSEFRICLNRMVYEIDRQERLHMEIPEETANALAELRRLVQERKNLNLTVDQSNWLAMVFLQCYNNDVQRTFRLMDFSFRLLYKDRDYSKPYGQVRQVFEEGLIRYLPEYDDDGTVIVVVEMGRRWNTSKISLAEFISAIRLSGIAIMLNPDAQRNGCKVIFDVDGLTMGQISHFTPKSSSFLFDLIEKCTPISMKGMHTVNNGLMYNVLFAILKPFMSKELRESTFIHGKNWKSLGKYINAGILPAKYGGTSKAPEADGKRLGELLQHYNEYFVEYDSYGYTGNPDA